MQGTLEFVLQTARGVMASLALSYEVETGVNVNEAELKCMAENIYFEGRAEPMVGKIAIGHVVMNRIEDERFPDTICGVIQQGQYRTNWQGNVVPVLHKCQFSYYCDGKPETIEDSKTWNESYMLATLLVNGMYDFTHGASHYHNDQVHPYWADHLYKTVVIDNHIFYK